MDSCSICHRRYSDPPNNRAVTTPCKHTFHIACLRTWTQRSDTCPMCRAVGLKRNLNNQVYEKMNAHMNNLRNMVETFEKLFKRLYPLVRRIPQNVYVNRTWHTRANTNDTPETVNGVNGVIRLVLFELLFNTQRTRGIVLTIYIRIIKQIHKTVRFAVNHGYMQPNTPFVDSNLYEAIQLGYFTNKQSHMFEYVVKSVDSFRKLIREIQLPTYQISKRFRNKYPKSLPPTAYRTLFFVRANARNRYENLPIPSPKFTSYKRLVKSLFQSTNSTTNRRVRNSISKASIVLRKQREAFRRSMKKRKARYTSSSSSSSSSSKRQRI